jgi:hypothetical protein
MRAVVEDESPFVFLAADSRPSGLGAVMGGADILIMLRENAR